MDEIVETVAANPTWPVGLLIIVFIGLAAFLLMRKKKTSTGSGSKTPGGPPQQRK